MSTIIKSDQTGPILQRLSTVDLADHLAQARAVIEEAKRKAAGIVERARRETELALAEAKKSGYDTGHELGYAAGTSAGHEDAHRQAIDEFHDQHANVVSAMQAAISQIDAMKGDLHIAAEKDLTDFALFAAGKLTFEIGRQHSEAATANLSRALRQVGSRTDLTIRVHPRDIESIERFAESALETVGASRAVRIVPDDQLAPGGCVVQTERTEIDATLETQVAEMVSLLAGGRVEHD